MTVVRQASCIYPQAGGTPPGRAIEGIDIINAENGTSPPSWLKIRCQGKVDKSFPSLEGTEPRRWPPVHQRESQCRVESDGLWHGAHGKGDSAYVLDHGRSFILRQQGGASGLLQAADKTRAVPCRDAVSRMLSQHLWVGQAFRTWLACGQNAHAPPALVVRGTRPVLFPRAWGKVAKVFTDRYLSREVPRASGRRLACHQR